MREAGQKHVEQSGTLLLSHEFVRNSNREAVDFGAWYRERVELNPGCLTNAESLLPVIQISPATVDMK